jgi:hypothetical protein
MNKFGDENQRSIWVVDELQIKEGERKAVKNARDKLTGYCDARVLFDPDLQDYGTIAV